MPLNFEKARPRCCLLGRPYTLTSAGRPATPSVIPTYSIG